MHPYVVIDFNSSNRQFQSAEQVMDYYHCRKIDQCLIDELIYLIDHYTKYLDDEFDYATRDELLEMIHQLNRIRWYAVEMYNKK